MKLKTLNVKTHRDGSFFLFFFLYKWTVCLFYSSNEGFSVTYWATKATQMPIIITEEMGFCTQLNLQYGMKSFSIHKKYIALYSKVDLIL